MVALNAKLQGTVGYGAKACTEAAM